MIDPDFVDSGAGAGYSQGKPARLNPTRQDLR
jgi:hypothetical protein